MRIDRYYVISALPAAGELGSAPPIGFAELMEHVGERAPRGRLVGTVLLSDDLLQREAFLAGEVEEVEPAVLSVPQARGEAPLPEHLAPPAEQEALAIEADRVWEAYFRSAAAVAVREGSEFLARWVGFEVALRNALASERAKRLGLEPAMYLVAADLAGEEEEDFGPVLRDWAAAATPLAGLRVVIRARWEWLRQHEAWFSFSEDELLVYAVRLMLLAQWRRTGDEGDGKEG